MRWLSTVSDPAFDYRFAVTKGHARPDDLEARAAGWLWLPVCFNLARCRGITWLGASGSILVGDDGVGLRIERIHLVALEGLPGRWRTREPFPVLALHPAWGAALSLGNGIEKAKTLATDLEVSTLVANDRDSGMRLLQEKRPSAQLWRTVA